MQLPPRARHRLKNISDEPVHPITRELLSCHHGKQIVARPPGLQTQMASASTATPSSATSTMNQYLDIRRRYTLPLLSEMHDLPSESYFKDRLLPLCYEEGLSSGVADVEACTALLSSAVEFFARDQLTTAFSRLRSDAPVSRMVAINPAVAGGTKPTEKGGSLEVAGYKSHLHGTPQIGILTSQYKKRLEAEEAAYARGEIKRNEAGLLPVEQQNAAAAGHGTGERGDWSLTWQFGDVNTVSLAPWMREKAVLRDLDELEAGDDEVDSGYGSGRASQEPNGKDKGRTPLLQIAAGQATEKRVPVFANEEDDAMLVDETEWGWQGAAPEDKAKLGGLLDECLAIE